MPLFNRPLPLTPGVGSLPPGLIPYIFSSRVLSAATMRTRHFSRRFR